jgi:transcriptional regulator with PAS, ATPase and Fis domain
VTLPLPRISSADSQEPFPTVSGYPEAAKESADFSTQRLNLRLVVVVPVIFILVSLGVGLLSMTLTQWAFNSPPIASKTVLFLRAGIIGLALLTALLGGLFAYAMTKPVRKAIAEAQKMIQYATAKPATYSAATEVGALSVLFDQALISFVELVQAREMLDGINEAILALDEEGKIAGMNLKAQELLENQISTARGRTLGEIYGDTVNGILAGIADDVLGKRQERAHNRVPFRSPSGKDYLLSVRASPLKLKGEPRRPIGTIIALSERAEPPAAFPGVVGNSEVFLEVVDLVTKVAPTEATVLILGESGTGKEIIADAIHGLSLRRNHPFIKINCAAIPEGLLESELFGHEKGAFTGATTKKQGKFELADKGTVFLDEIGDMSLSTQAKVLRLLQEKEFTPVGGNQVKKVDVRIVAATNKDLFQEIQRGRFREDLFYRLNVVTICVPPLRDRKSDIPFLVDRFLDESAKQSAQDKKALSKTAMDRLLAHSWPGNVRELKNVLERASLLSNGATIQVQDLPLSPSGQPLNSGVMNATLRTAEDKGLVPLASLNEVLDTVEKQLIVEALRKSRGIQVEAAKLLGLSNKNLWHKIRKHQISPEEHKG